MGGGGGGGGGVLHFCVRGTPARFYFVDNIHVNMLHYKTRGPHQPGSYVCVHMNWNPAWRGGQDETRRACGVYLAEGIR